MAVADRRRPVRQASTAAPEPALPVRSYGPWFIAKWVLLVVFNGLVLALHPPLDRREVVVPPGVSSSGRSSPST